MQARYYDPVIGRFYSNDPVDVLGHLSGGNVQGFNRYAYANNNPYKYVDPDGEVPIVPVLIAGGRACASNAACRGAVVKGAKHVAKGARKVADAVSGILGAVFNESTEIEGAVDLEDQLAGEELVGEIEAGEGKVLEGMGDEKFDPETGTHDKVAKNRQNADGTKTELHAERNRETGKVDC